MQRLAAGKRSLKATRPWLGMLVLALLSACTIQAPKVDLDKASAGRIKKIALVAIDEPEVQVTNIGGAPAAFGLVGYVVQESFNKSNSALFERALEDKKVRLGEAMAIALQNALRAKGFEVVYLRNQRPKGAADGVSLDYSAIVTDADALLAVRLNAVGYVSTPMALRYEPWIHASVRLLDARTKEVLFLRSMRSGSISSVRVENIEDVGGGEKYRYATADGLIASAAEAAEGLHDIEGRIAARIAQHLR